jgi:hypothetical protein
LSADEEYYDDCDDGDLLWWPLLSFSPSIIVIVEEMIRDEVIFWGAAVLLVVFAFILMPAHERFKDAQGREVDVDPNAPPKPEWLKPINERTGKREGFWSSLTSFFSPTREKMRSKDAAQDFQKYLNSIASNETSQNTSNGSPAMPPLSGITAQQSSTPPQFTTDSTLGSTTGTTGMEKTLTQGDLQDAQVRFIQTLIGNEPDQATKRGLANGVAVLQQLAKSAPTSVTNVPIGSFERAVYNSLTTAPSSYTYKQFAMAYQSAGGVNASFQNIVQMVQSIPSGINMTAPPPQIVSNVSQMSDMGALTPPDLYGPGPNVLRSALKSCSCGSQTSGCPIHA